MVRLQDNHGIKNPEAGDSQKHRVIENNEWSPEGTDIRRVNSTFFFLSVTLMSRIHGKLSNRPSSGQISASWGQWVSI